MIKDLKSFQMDLKRFYEVVTPQNHTKLCIKLALKLHQSIVAGCPENPKGTPVDTGWARANWGVKIGFSGLPNRPVGDKPEEGSPPIPANSYFEPNSILTVKSVGKFPFIWVYNNVPYIEKLEDGHSGQSPTGMVANALNNVQTFVNNL